MNMHIFNEYIWKSVYCFFVVLVSCTRFMSLLSAVLQIFLSAEGCGRLAEGLRFNCGQYGSFAVFAAVYLRRFSAVFCGCRTADNRCLNRTSVLCKSQ